MDNLALLQKILIWTPGVLLAVTLHEWGHGFAATLLGDPTPRRTGRLTLNPIAHIDPVWSILVPLVLLAMGPFVFGGAKPVLVDPRYFRHGRRAMFWVAAAGPMMNLLLALASALLVLLTGLLPVTATVYGWVAAMALASIQMNVMLAVFNLLPMLPLDGGRMVMTLLPDALARLWSSTERIGLVVVMALALSGWLSPVLNPLQRSLLRPLIDLAGL
ncbi:MAG: site-2 protease family protein [Magnetococcales bacterium]|nr:site-2 protease family protein [Magnetococcales bacterium]